MRIIITQAEIELAIREHVLSSVSIKEGQLITVAFKNTRGDDGATAEIDITNPQQGEQITSAPTIKSAPSVDITASLGTVITQSPSAVAAEPVQEEPATEVAPEPSQTSPAPAAEAGNTSATEVASNVETASTTLAQTTSSEQVVGENTEAVKPVVKSLFANLTPPVNKK